MSFVPAFRKKFLDKREAAVKTHSNLSKESILKLSFSEIEKTLGFDLPTSAYSAQLIGQIIVLVARSWLNAGYRAEQLNLMEQTALTPVCQGRIAERMDTWAKPMYRSAHLSLTRGKECASVCIFIKRPQIHFLHNQK